MCKDGRPADADISSLLLVVLTGAPVTLNQIKYFRSCFPNTILANVHGQTELCGQTLAFRPDLNPKDTKFLMEKPLSVGKPMPSYSYKV